MCKEVCDIKCERKYVVLSVKENVGIKCEGKCVVFSVQGSVWY